MPGRRSILKSILKTAACFLMLCLVSLFVYVKYWAVPDYVRTQFESIVSRYWDGQFRCEGVRFSFSGQVCLEGVSFLDNESREWAYVGKIVATLGNWPSRTLYVRDVEIDDLGIKFHAYARKETFPLKASPRGSSKKKHEGVLRRVTVNDSSVEMIHLNRGRVPIGRLSVLANRIGEKYEILSSLARSDEPNDIVAKGTVDTTSSEVDFSLTVDRDLDGEELALLLSLLKPSMPCELAGRLTVDVGIKGKLSDPGNILIQGDVRCKNGSVSVDGRTVVADVNAVMVADGHQLDLKESSGSFCNGTIQSALHIDDYRSESMGIAGELQLKDFDLAKLVEKSAHESRITTGKATFEYSFTATNTDPNSLSGKGSLDIDDADMLPMPLLSKISRTVGLKDKEMQATSDVVVLFTNYGYVIKVEQGYLTNKHEAIAVEPGGTVDLQGRTIDMYIIATQLRVVSEFMRKLPVVKLVVGLSDKLTRLRLKGQWTDPASKLIKKEPIKDVKEGVSGFFVEAARSGGKLTDSVLDTGRGIFGGSKKRD